MRLLSNVRARRPVLVCYHGIGPSTAREDPDFLRVAEESFRQQVELLVEAGFEFVTVADLARRLAHGRPVSGLASLSFDDGMQDNHSVLLPILRELGVPATVYVTTGLIGAPNPFVRDGSRMMTVEELRELRDAGVELGAHTVTHPDLSVLDRAACMREVSGSRDALERLTGAPVTTLAYPFGRSSATARIVAREAGFSAAVGATPFGGGDPFNLARELISGKDGIATFALKVARRYWPLMNTGRGRLVRGSTRRIRRTYRLITRR